MMIERKSSRVEKMTSMNGAVQEKIVISCIVQLTRGTRVEINGCNGPRNPLLLFLSGGDRWWWMMPLRGVQSKCQSYNTLRIRKCLTKSTFYFGLGDL